MIVYLIILAAIPACAVPFCIFNPSRAKLATYLAIMGMALVIVSGTRYGVGDDYHKYAGIFSMQITGSPQLGNYLDRHGFEPGFILLMKAMGAFGLNVTGMFFCMALLMVAPVLWLIYRYSANVWLSLFLYVALTLYFGTMSLYRQQLAAYIALLGYPYLKNGKLWRYLAIVAAAATFHLSALVMPVFFLLCRAPFSWKTVMFYAVGGSCAYLFVYPVFELMVCLFPRYGYYLDSGWFRMGGMPKEFLIMPGLLVLFALLYFGCAKPTGQDLQLHAVCCFFLCWLAADKVFVLQRFDVFFAPYLLLLIPDMLERCRVDLPYSGESILLRSAAEKGIHAAAMCLTVSVAFLYCLFMISRNSYGVFPYRSILGG